MIRAQFFPLDTERMRSANSTITERSMNPKDTARFDLMVPSVTPDTKNSIVNKDPIAHITHMIHSALLTLAGRFAGLTCLVSDW
jgi:hypothetical protein